MDAAGIVAIVPMKPLHSAKMRLAGVLSPSDRAALSLGMMRNVVTAAQSVLGEVWVVGGDDAVRCAAEPLGARWHEDPATNLNDTLSIAMQWAFAAGKAALYLPSDLPLLTAADVRALVQASADGTTLTLAAAKRDGGTNAILTPCGSHFRPALGHQSFQRHKELAQRLDIPFVVCDTAGLALDLDTPSDLAACVEVEAGFVRRLTGDELVSLTIDKPVSESTE